MGEITVCPKNRTDRYSFGKESGAAGMQNQLQITGDGGLSKVIHRAGQGDKKPEIGDTVEVHYLAFIEGWTEYDSSYKADKPCKFTLGQGEVIKGWELGIPTMSKGEKALLICGAKYAYSKRGIPGVIPPHATLHFVMELLGWHSAKDITGDRGVLKDVLEYGVGHASPKAVDICTVAYSVRVRGQDDFVAVPGKEQGYEELTPSSPLPIMALKPALQRMLLGEHAKLTALPEYGFDPEVRPAGVGPEDILEIDIHLKAWDTVVPLGDGGAMTKRILQPSDGGRLPQLGATAKAVLTGRLLDGTPFEEHSNGNPLRITIGAEDVVEGLDLALASMRVGELAQVTVPPSQGYGSSPKQAPLGEVPSCSILAFTVELLHVEEIPDPSGLPPAEKLAEAERLKAAGTAFFNRAKYRAALRWYEAAERLVSLEPRFFLHLQTDADDRQKAAGLRKSCLLNIAAAALKLARWQRVKSACDKVLAGGGNVKALSRRAEAHLAGGDNAAAQADVRRAIGIEPRNGELPAQLRRIKTEAAAADKAFKPLASTMSEAVSPEPQQGPQALTETAGPQAVRYPKGPSTRHLDLTNEDLVAEHEWLLDALDTSIAEEVREMKANHGFPTQPPAPSQLATRSRPVEQLPYLVSPIRDRMLAQSSQGRGYTRPMGFGTRGGARLQLPKPELKEQYLEVPSYSQLNASVSAIDEIMAAADPYAMPIIITASLQDGDGGRAGHAHPYVPVAPEPQADILAADAMPILCTGSQAIAADGESLLAVTDQPRLPLHSPDNTAGEDIQALYCEGTPLISPSQPGSLNACAARGGVSQPIKPTSAQQANPIAPREGELHRADSFDDFLNGYEAAVASKAFVQGADDSQVEPCSYDTAADTAASRTLMPEGKKEEFCRPLTPMAGQGAPAADGHLAEAKQEGAGGDQLDGQRAFLHFLKLRAP